MYVWGQLLQAGLEHSASDPTPAFKGRVYWNTVSDVPKVYDGTNWLIVPKFASDGSLAINGDLTVDGTITLEEEVIVKELASTPSSPAAGYKKIYPKDNGKLYTLDENGIEQAVGAGGGAGSINYIDNSDAEVDTSGWVDGTAIAITRSTSTPLRGDASFLITTTSSVAAGAYVAYPFTLDSADANKVLSLSFDHTNGPTAYASGDMEVVVVRDPSGTPEVITPATSAIPATTGAHGFATTWVSGAAGAYELRFRAVTATSAYDVKLDNVSVGPQSFAFGTPESDWETFTVTSSWVSNVTWIGYKKRQGQNLKVRIQGNLSGAPTSANLTFNLPSGLTIDTTAFPADTDNYIVGKLQVRDEGTNRFLGGIRYNTTTTLGAFTWGAASTFIDAPSTVTQASPMTFATGDHVFVEFEVPIAEWAGSSIWLSSAKAEYVSHNGTNVVYGSQGATIPTSTPSGASDDYTLTFLSPVQPTDKFIVEISRAGTDDWMPAGGDIVDRLWYNGTNLIGVGVQSNGSGGVKLTRGKYRLTSTSAWSTVTAGTKWRVVKYPGVIQSAMPVDAVPTAMSDSIATALGKKVYQHGTTYAGGNAPTVTTTASSGVIQKAIFMPYQMQGGEWRLRFNLAMTYTSTSNHTITVNGVLFDATTNFNQPCAVRETDMYANAEPNTATLIITSSTSRVRTSVSGDVALASKPTWAY